MSLVPAVGRKTAKVRFFVLMVYSALIMLGITMVTPFLITITGSTANDFDYERFWPAPRYFWSTKDRYIKCLVPYFNYYRNWTKQMKAYIPEKPDHWSSWSLAGRDIKNVDRISEEYIAEFKKNPDIHKTIAADYAEFCETYPLSDKIVYAAQPQVVKFLIPTFEKKYEKRFPEKVAEMSGGELREAALNMLGNEWSLPFESFYNISFNTEMNYPMDFQGWFPPLQEKKYQAYNKFKKAVESHFFTPGIKDKWLDYLKEKGYPANESGQVFPLDGSQPKELKKLWLEFKKHYAPATPAVPYALRAAWYDYLLSEDVAQFLKLKPSDKFSIDMYNRLAGTNFKNLYKTPFPIPEFFAPGIQNIWKKYKKERYPLRLVKITPSPELNKKYHAFIKKTLKTLRIANNLLGTKCESWNEFKLTANPEEGVNEKACNRRDIWKNFVKVLPLSNKTFCSSERAYQKFLLKKYGSLEAVNKKYGWNLKYIEQAFPAFMSAYTTTFLNNEYNLSFIPMFSNYMTVIDFLLFNGNAIFVTFVLIAMTIAFTLTVNPLAAYALSRFNLRGQDKILLFLLATMAFPAMISAIPAYLLMRDLGLLNTFWALVIPGAANGMSIFILKGFFDSLPMELFEAATIDGATEMQIFRIVAMPLVKPILAINCLTAFVIAYNGWQWALIICQDKEMWTIAVWLYQATTWWSGTPWIVSAGFVIASVPTFLVFVSCQKIILRGIVIPSMK
jgi:ABC-type glycerol-3-phosphate transport system permease component